MTKTVVIVWISRWRSDIWASQRDRKTRTCVSTLPTDQ